MLERMDGDTFPIADEHSPRVDRDAAPTDDDMPLLPTPAASPAPFAPSDDDRRLYVLVPDGWKAVVKSGWEREYCFSKNPGEDYFHLLMGGEIYLQFGDEKYCLTCALKRGIVTTDRLHWQHAAKTDRKSVF